MLLHWGGHRETTQRRRREGERDRKDRETEPGPQRKTLNGCEGAKNREDQGITEREEDGGMCWVEGAVKAKVKGDDI